MLSKDLSFAVRTLRNNPAFTVTAALTLALGIGSTTAIFSVVNALLLRPLPYTQPERLVMIQSDMRARRVRNFPIPPGDVPDIRARATAFENTAAAFAGPWTFLGEDNKPEQITGSGVTPNFFNLLGLRIAFGRNFVESDATPPPRPAPGQAGPGGAPA